MEQKGVIIAIVIIMIMGLMALVSSLHRQLDIKPAPTKNPNQPMGFGCLMVLLFLVGVAIVFISRGGV